jgi:hypothetical protein
VVKMGNEREIGIRSEKGGHYMPDKEEKTLTIGILKRTLTSSAGRDFLVENSGIEGFKIAVDLLQAMGVQLNQD